MTASNVEIRLCVGNSSETRRNSFIYVQYLQPLQEVLDQHQMHYEVDLLILEESLEYLVRQQLKLSPVALNGMQKSWTKKESSNSTQVKFPAALRSSGVLVKNRLTRGIFHGPMTEKMTLWVLLWHCFFMSCTLGVMGRDVVEICPAYMASTTAVPARVHHPQCHWQGSDASS